MSLSVSYSLVGIDCQLNGKAVIIWRERERGGRWSESDSSNFAVETKERKKDQTILDSLQIPGYSY